MGSGGETVGGAVNLSIYLWGYVCAFDFPQIGILLCGTPKGQHIVDVGQSTLI